MRVEVIFEDRDDGKGGVAVICTPKAELLFNKYKMRKSMTPAEAMAVICISAAINEHANAGVIEKMTGKDRPLIIQN